MEAYLKEVEKEGLLECSRCGETVHEDFLWVGDLCDTCHDDMH